MPSHAIGREIGMKASNVQPPRAVNFMSRPFPKNSFSFPGSYGPKVFSFVSTIYVRLKTYTTVSLPRNTPSPPLMGKKVRKE